VGAEFSEYYARVESEVPWRWKRTNLWSKCVNLRCVHFYEDTSIAEIKALMLVPKSLLKVVYISLKKGSSETKEIMDVLAGGTGGLEEIEVRCSGPPRGAFDKLVCNNKMLVSVEIFLLNELRHRIDDAATCEVLNTFLKSRAVREIVIKDSYPKKRIDRIDDICHEHRFRRVCVNILGVHYMR